VRISDWSSDVCSSDLVSSKLIGLTLRHAELGLQRIRPVRRQILDLRDRRLQRATLFGCGARRRLRGVEQSRRFRAGSCPAITRGNSLLIDHAGTLAQTLLELRAEIFAG